MSTRIILVDGKECKFNRQGMKYGKVQGRETFVSQHSSVCWLWNRRFSENQAIVTGGHVYIMNYNKHTYVPKEYHANIEAWEKYKNKK